MKVRVVAMNWAEGRLARNVIGLRLRAHLKTRFDAWKLRKWSKRRRESQWLPWLDLGDLGISDVTMDIEDLLRGPVVPSKPPGPKGTLPL